MEEELREEAFDYLRKERTGVIALCMPDGSPHASTVHFAFRENPFQFVILTDRQYRKGEALTASPNVSASFVVGTVEMLEGQKTLQLDGIASLTEDVALQEVYFSKFPEARKYDGPDDIFFVFTPTWWRYIDWGREGGKTILTSSGELTVKPKK